MGRRGHTWAHRQEGPEELSGHQENGRGLGTGLAPGCPLEGAQSSSRLPRLQWPFPQELSLWGKCTHFWIPMSRSTLAILCWLGRCSHSPGLYGAGVHGPLRPHPWQEVHVGTRWPLSWIHLWVGGASL